MLCSDTSMCCILHIYDSVYDVNYAIQRVQHNTLKSCCYRFIGLKYEGMKTKVLPVSYIKFGINDVFLFILEVLNR